jgi:hypothetical protein
MTVRERVVRGSVASEHIVQFFDTDESRAQCVAEFLAEGISRGEPAMIVAKPLNWAATLEQLEGRRIPVERAIDKGMLLVKNADEMLRRISPNGVPDATAFETVLGKSVAAMAHRYGRVRAYGEMVDMLAEQGELADAIKLENLWNSFSERTPILLLCGYSAAHFVSSSTHRALRDICGAHSGVHRHAQDPLASWLLNTAHNASGAASITH